MSTENKESSLELDLALQTLKALVKQKTKSLLNPAFKEISELAKLSTSSEEGQSKIKIMLLDSLQTAVIHLIADQRSRVHHKLSSEDSPE